MDEVDTDTWVATPPAWQQPRLFGGHAMALALAAAARTTNDNQPVHSVHAQFLRAAPAGEALRLVVQRIRDGRNVSLRRVELLHGSKAAVIVDLSFHHVDLQPFWQAEPLEPAQVVGLSRTEGAMQDYILLEPFEIVPLHPYETDRTRPHPYWARPRGSLGDDSVLHACALLWLSDMAITVSSHRPGTLKHDQHGSMSLRQDVWFHQPPRFDDWLRVDVEPAVNASGRALVHGRFVAPDGVIGPRFVQDVLLNPPGGRVSTLYNAKPQA